MITMFSTGIDTEQYTTKLDKVVRIGTIPTYGKRRISIYCHIQFDGYKLSITGVEGPLPSGNCVGSCGQIDSGYDHKDKSQNDARTRNPIKATQINFADGWSIAKWYEFLDVWDKNHLNDMSPACEHQIALGWNKEPIDPTRPTTDYDKFDGKRNSWNLKSWVYEPLGYLAKPCPVCGYKYGTKWLHKEIPVEAIEFLMSLPETDKEPAWV